MFLGGGLGVLAREALMLAIPDEGSVPVAVLVANVLGAFLLGLLLESAPSLWPEPGRRQSWRLLLGTGVLGGFTTYSALAQAVMVLGRDGAAGLAIAYGLGTLLLGGLATWLGVMLGGMSARTAERRRGSGE